METTDRAATIDLLQKEYDRAQQEVIAARTRLENILGVGISLLSLSVAYGLGQEKGEVLYLVAAAVLVLTFHVLGSYNLVLALAGHKRAIEDRINELRNDRVMVWESEVIGPVVYGRVGHSTVLAALVLFPLAVLAFATRHAHRTQGTVGLTVAAVVSAVALALLLHHIRRSHSAFHRAYHMSSRALRPAGAASLPAPAAASSAAAVPRGGLVPSPHPGTRRARRPGGSDAKSRSASPAP